MKWITKAMQHDADTQKKVYKSTKKNAKQCNEDQENIHKPDG